MSVKLYRYFTLALTILFCACNSSKEQKSLNHDTISMVNSHGNAFDAKKYFESIKLLQLKSDGVYFGDINKLEIKNNRVYILDNTISNSLFVFDLNGELVFTYQNEGRAPGQYLQLSDFIVNKDETVELLDSFLQKIFILDSDGKLIGEKKLSINASDFYKYDNRYYFHTNNMALSNDNSSTGLLISADFDLIQYETIVPIDEYRGEFILHQRGNYFFNFMENAYFMDLFSNTAISLNKNLPNILFDFSKNAFPPDFFKTNQFFDQGLYLNFLFEKEYAWNLTGFYQFDTKLFFKFSLGMQDYFCIYDTISKTSSQIKKGYINSTDPCFALNTVPLAKFDNYLIFSLSANEAKRLVTKGCSQLLLEEIDENNILLMVEIKTS
jgi:hypothetical protein